MQESSLSTFPSPPVLCWGPGGRRDASLRTTDSADLIQSSLQWTALFHLASRSFLGLHTLFSSVKFAQSLVLLAASPPFPSKPALSQADREVLVLYGIRAFLTDRYDQLRLCQDIHLHFHVSLVMSHWYVIGISSSAHPKLTWISVPLSQSLCLCLQLSHRCYNPSVTPNRRAHVSYGRWLSYATSNLSLIQAISSPKISRIHIFFLYHQSPASNTITIAWTALAAS